MQIDETTHLQFQRSLRYTDDYATLDQAESQYRGSNSNCVHEDTESEHSPHWPTNQTGNGPTWFLSKSNFPDGQTNDIDTNEHATIAIEHTCETGNIQYDKKPLAPPDNIDSGEEPKNSSLVTIFAIWNGMMGTSLLAMPWLVLQCGLVMAVFVFVGMTLVCVFTAYTVLTVQASLGMDGMGNHVDFCGVMRRVLPKRWDQIGVIFSISVMLGAMLVYWVLMSDFLFFSVDMFIYDNATVDGRPENVSTIHGAICPSSPSVQRFRTSSESLSIFFMSGGNFWSQTTASITLAVFLFPLMIIKNPTFFTKFTGIGTISVMYILVFVTIKSSSFGINVSFIDQASDNFVSLYRPKFPAAMGTLSMALFIHNCLCDIMKNNRHQQNNVRDLLTAYSLVFATYFYIGIVFYLAWPLQKGCIQENLLDNFVGADTLSAIGRWCLLFQLCTVFPLLGCIVRGQLMTFLFGSPYPSMWRVSVLNAVIVVSCVVVAVFYPHIGQLTRFSGSLCGLAWIFTFPSVVYVVGKRRCGQHLSRRKLLLHCSIVLFGFINFALQFAISAK